jgi:uncharacterized metal-binding protein YceD (DUF177 family)
MPPSPDLPISLPFRSAALSNRKVQRFELVPSPGALVDLATLLGITAVRRLRFTGEIRPLGRRDFELEARLEAVVEQPCVITLAPVRTEVDEIVVRRYLAEMEFPDAEEVEMPEDDTFEPLPDVIDAGAVAAEALALALPLYPRAPGAELAPVVAAPPGVAPLSDADLKPFAGLKALVDRPSGGTGSGDENKSG